jgi:hypothetical protein
MSRDEGLGSTPAPENAMKITIAVLLSGSLLFAGCVTTVDVRSQLERQVLPPAGLQQVQFAYLGTVETPDGPLCVATQRLVVTGMPCPRGQSWLHLFSRDCRLVRSYSFDTRAEPLWCEGTRIYLKGFGNIGDIAPDEELKALFRYPEEEKENGYPAGNVIDFCHGAQRPVLRRVKRYGSSGGISDDPMKIGDADDASHGNR